MNKIVDHLEYLYSLERRGIKVGLEHTYQLLDQIGNPQQSFKSIHVAGTNGKGSTCANLASILKNANYTVGLYTSPHLVHFNERIRVNGLPISDDNILKFISQVRPHLETIKTTFFEATTAMAFWYFREKNVDVAIVETGLGGRRDSTNVLNPIQTIINASNVNCYGGSDGRIAVHVYNAALPFSIYLDGVLNTNPVDSVFLNVPAGQHIITVIDNNNCMLRDTINTLVPASPLQLLTSSKTTVCHQDSTAFSVAIGAGGTPSYLYNWYSGVVGPNSPTISN